MQYVCINKGLAEGALTSYKGIGFAQWMPPRVISKKKKEHPRNLTHTPTYVYLGINKGLAEGALTPYKGIEFALADAPASHLEVIQHSQGTKGKIILKIRDGEGKMEL